MIGTRRKEGKVVRATERQLDEQVLYHKDNFDNYDVTISDYWDRIVCRKNPDFAKHSFKRGDNKVICPFHEDIAPSLGIVYDPETKVEVFNCFGCGKHGTVITFHELFFKKYNILKSDNHLDYLKRLAQIYHVPLELEITQKNEDSAKTDFKREPPYTLRVHTNNVSKIKAQRENLSLSEYAGYFDMLTQRILKAKKGAKSDT